MMKLSILPPGKARIGQLAISPDGRWLTFTAATDGKVQLWVRGLDTTDARVLPGTEEASSPFWSPDSQWIGFFAAGQLKKTEISGGLPTTLCGVGVATGGTWSRDGVILYSDRTGRNVGALDELGDAGMVSLSPDDQRFVVSRLDHTVTGNNDLWLSAAKGGNATRFTFDQANDHFPVWSPDGTRIVWSSNRDGVYQLYEKAASGAGQDALLLKTDHFKFPTDWSRDGRFILYRKIGLLLQQHSAVCGCSAETCTDAQ
jgi:Tol biopolymer transport system component